MSDLHIVTVATHPEFYFKYLIESCKKNGKELDVLGFGEKWKGFTWRFTLMLEYLKKLDKNDIVCFIDGYDVICTRNLNELKDEFIKIKNETDCKIIVGHDKIITDTIFYHLYYLKTINKFDQCKNIDINAGTYIGYVIDLIDILEKIYNLNPNDAADDQILLTKYCNMCNNNDIFIDIDNKIFLTLDKPFAEIDNLIEINNNEIIYNNNKPFFLHGPGETYLNNVIKLLGYDLNDNKIKNSMINKSIRRTLFEWKNNKNIQIFFIIIVLITAIYFWKLTYKIDSFLEYVKKLDLMHHQQQLN
jgi:hypothetical protein